MSHSFSDSSPSLSRRVKTGWLLAVLLVFAAGLAIRVYDLTDPPLDFHPARQLHSAIMARGMLAESGGGDFTAFERERAASLGQGEAVIEPPILEGLTALTYRLLDREVLWVARLYSIVFWLLGGLAVLALGRNLSASRFGSLAALLFYLVLPYAVIASRSFQPDPLMVALLAGGMWALERWVRKPSMNRAVAAGLLAGLALLVKQVTIFPLLGAGVGLVLAGMGLRRALRERSLWLLVGLALIPVAAYNLYGLLGSGALGGQYSLRFFPRLWIDPAYYIRWAQQIDQTVGLAPLLLAVLGTFLIRQRHARGLMLGLWAGYLLYGFTFAYHISTHDYYQLPLIPIVALGLAPLAGAVYTALRERLSLRWANALLAAVLAVGSLFSLYSTLQVLKKADYRDQPALWYGLAEQLNFDSGGIIGLFDDYGARLMYYGYVNPGAWATTGDVEMRELAGQTLAPAVFEDRTAGRSFFVITNLPDLERQPALKATLEENYPLLAQGPGYRVYDLRVEK